MTNLLQKGATWLGTKLKDATVAGRSVTYKRGQLESGTIQAVCSERNEEVVDEQGFATWVKRYDWTFTTTDMLLRSEAITPRAGDLIIETLNSVECHYQVVNGPGGNPCFEWVDTSGVLTVVHTNKVK